MGDHLGPTAPDGGGGQVVRIHRHAAGHDNQLGALIQIILDGPLDHGQVIIAECTAQHLGAKGLQLPAYHRLKQVLDAAGIDFAAGDNDAHLLLPVGQQLQQGPPALPAQLLGLADLLLLGDQRDDAHTCLLYTSAPSTG